MNRIHKYLTEVIYSTTGETNFHKSTFSCYTVGSWQRSAFYRLLPKVNGLFLVPPLTLPENYTEFRS